MTQIANIDSANVPAGLEPLVVMASVSDRRKIVKHFELCEAEPDRGHAEMWKRLAVKLAGLAPKALNTIGSLSIRFYKADGKYRKQLFALEDLRNGSIIVYTGNVLKAAVSKKLVLPVEKAGSNAFGVPGTDEYLDVESLATTNADPPLYKDMLGWNRTAMKITLSTNATEPQIRAAEQLCELAAGE